MKKYKSIVEYCIIISTIISCSSLSEIRYEKAYQVITKDFIDKDISIKQFGKDISGVYVYDSIYPSELDNLDSSKIYKNIFSEKGDVQSLRKDDNLKKIMSKYKNPNWYLDSKFNTVWESVVQYEGTPNGPLSAAVFSEIKDDQLRIDVIPFFVKTPKYCGSVNKYYFKFYRKKIIENKKWVDHYECW